MMRAVGVFQTRILTQTLTPIRGPLSVLVLVDVPMLADIRLSLGIAARVTSRRGVGPLCQRDAHGKVFLPANGSRSIGTSPIVYQTAETAVATFYSLLRY